VIARVVEIADDGLLELGEGDMECITRNPQNQNRRSDRTVVCGCRVRQTSQHMTEFSIQLAGPDRMNVAGDIDLCTAPEFAEALAAHGPDLDLDLSRCTFMDSSGISALVHAKTEGVPNLRVVEASLAVRRVLDLCGLSAVFLGDQAAIESN
jgi:anti-anti-sigma factor